MVHAWPRRDRRDVHMSSTPGRSVAQLTFSISNLRRGTPALLSLALLGEEENADATISFSCDEAMFAFHARS